MFKTNTLNFVTPVVNSSTRIPGSKAISRSLTARTWSQFGFRIEYVALVGTIAFIALLVMHVIWINSYSAKGFELKRVQTAISEQTAKQKRLLVQQSLLGSTNSLAVAEQNNLVPVTEVEYLNTNNLAQVK